MATAIKEYDELKRKLEGERKAGGDRQSIRYTVANGQGWTQEQTAKDLGISRQAVSKDIKIATAIEEYDDLKRELEGEKPQGGRPSQNLLQCNEFWSQRKTAEDLGKANNLEVNIVHYKTEVRQRKTTVIDAWWV